MSMYLSKPTIKDAVDRLAISATQSTLADYLIFKRALVLTRQTAHEAQMEEPSAVVTGLGSKPFVDAIVQFAARVPDISRLDGITNPYFVPFGSARDKTLGYRSRKYPSNGPSDTVGRWQARSGSPLMRVPDTSPKAYTLQTRTESELADFFAVKSPSGLNSGHKAGLLDTAIWWFRFAEVADRFGREPNPVQLTLAFIKDFDLKDVEVRGLFDIAPWSSAVLFASAADVTAQAEER